MKKLIIVLLVSISMVGFAQTGEKNFIDQNYIEVTGKSELEIVPDLIYLRIVLSERDNKGRLTIVEIERVMLEKLAGIGIDVNANLSLLNFASTMRALWLKTEVVLTKQYQLIVQDAKTLEKVFFEFQNLGISNVSIVRFEHSKIEQYRQDVKVAAVKAAKEKAELLAVALGRKLGNALYAQEADVLNLNTMSNVVRKTPGRTVFSQDNYYSSSAENSSIEFEKIKIESTFLVRFGLE